MIRDAFFIGVGVVLAVTVPWVFNKGTQAVAWVRTRWANRSKLRIP